MKIISKFRSLLGAGAVLATALAVQGAPASAESTSLDLSQYRGKVVYVDFWASWCGPCKLSFPFMKSLASRYSPNDFAVVTINVDRARPSADAFLKQVNSNLPVIFDQKGALAGKYKVTDMPTSLIVDRKGNVRYRHQGFYEAKTAEYQAHVAELVRED